MEERRIVVARAGEMTAAEAVAAAAAEGLELVRAENSSGFKGVKRSTKHINKPFQAVPYGGGGRAGKTLYLGSFATAEEAALAVARALAAKAAAAEEAVEGEEEEGMEVDDDDEEEGEDDEVEVVVDTAAAAAAPEVSWPEEASEPTPNRMH